MEPKNPSVVVYRAPAALTFYPGNARTHSEEQVAQIAASIEEFGFCNPVLVDGEDGVIAGHGRLLAAMSLGLSEVPCIRLGHLSDVQKRALVIADNRLALSAGWDLDMLAFELAQLSSDGFDLALTGFDLDEIDALLQRATGTAGLTDEDEVPQVERGPAVTLPGNVWLMGAHRLMCGSCADADAVGELMQSDRADLCLSDPPYGLDKSAGSGKNDYVGYVDTRENLEQLAAEWLPIARSVSPVVVFSCGVTNQWIYPEPNWVMCWFYAGGPARSPWGFNCWQPFLCYGNEPGLAAGKGARPDAVDLNIAAHESELDHPCPKPVKLWEWFIERLVFKPAAVIYEPFCGSGTALIAAENERHAVRAMELTPHYVDVAVRRWQAYTGNEARLDGDGRSFDELAAERVAEEVVP